MVTALSLWISMTCQRRIEGEVRHGTWYRMYRSRARQVRATQNATVMRMRQNVYYRSIGLGHHAHFTAHVDIALKGKMSKNSSSPSSSYDSLSSHFESNKRSKEYIAHQSKVSALIVIVFIAQTLYSMIMHNLWLGQHFKYIVPTPCIIIIVAIVLCCAGALSGMELRWKSSSKWIFR